VTDPVSVVIVTGLSGAGKSTALHALEDLGFFCIDNLPTLLAPEAVAVCERGGITRIALGMDVRVRAFLGALGEVLREIGNANAPDPRSLSVVFLDASDESLLRRFGETRRPHPLSAAHDEHRAGSVAVLDGIQLERERLTPLRARADLVIDTTRLSVHELRKTILSRFGPAAGGAPRMHTRVVSFGFKYGAPVDADLVLDVRFLDNPYFVPELKALPGTDSRVSSFVLGLPEAKQFLDKTVELLSYVLPKYEREGKSYLTIAVGCTGGRHRSVAISEALAKALSAPGQGSIDVIHRDVIRGEGQGRDSDPGAPPPRKPEDL
jgi:RNase adapter protein RapZ